MNSLQSKSYLKKIMHDRGVTVREMALRSGLDVTTIMRARNDHHITSCTLDTLARIAEALSVNTKDLYEIGPAQKI